MQALTQDAQQFKTELDHLLAKEDLVGGLEHQVAELAHLIAGLHGLVLAEAAETVCMELQAEAEAEDQQEVEDLLAEAQEAHKQLITQVVKAWTEQVQAAEETTIQVETVKREVLA
jgi:HPt (histidine-containing phosphotransfer) domain-containing protein